MRIEGWESRLAAHIEAAYQQKFVWGQHDCVRWCAAWVLSATGQDLIQGAAYSSEAEATAVIASLGFDSLPALVDACLEPVAPTHAQRGDILLHGCGALGICIGMNGVFPTESGVVVSKTTSCPQAWRVS